MVSTYLRYDLVNRDMQKSISRVASESEVKRETDYFQANISKVKTVDEFMGNYRLYSYAMKSYGLEDMTYAKAFMKKVLDSDLTDSASFANALSDQKYRDFAAAFKFSTVTDTAQTTNQADATIQGYKDQIAKEADDANTETAYYKSQIANVTSVDDLMGNSRLYDYALKSMGIDPSTYTRAFIKQTLTSDINDPASYVNSLPEDTNARYLLKQKATALAAAFNFNGDGSLSSGVPAQNAAQLGKVTENYLITVPSHLTVQGALLNKAYIDETMANVTSVDQITSDSRLYGLVKTALGLPSSMLASTFKNIVTSDTSTNNNYAYQQGGNSWTAIADMFNFDANGNVASGDTAMSSENLKLLDSKYSSAYNDVDDANDAALYTYYKNTMGYVTSVDSFMGYSKLYDTAMKAVGLDPDKESTYKIKRVLESDISDPKSYVNQLGDQRYLDLARNFNFDKTGEITAPKTAQSQAEILHMSKNYIFQKTRFLSDAETTVAKAAATKEASYFNEKVQGVNNVSELLADKRVVNFMLTSVGMDPAKVSSDTLKKVFSSDLSDPKSFANKQSDSRFAELAAAFNFDTSGNVKNMDTSDVMSRRALFETVDGYQHQTLEVEEGDENPGVRLALYFQREAPKISSAYSILGDTALLQVFKTAFDLPDEFSNLNIDVQYAKVNQFMQLSDLKDPDKLNTFINRFTALYDLKNGETSSTVSLLSAGSGGISANTLLTLSQLKLY
jgi:hypothetical protein